MARAQSLFLRIYSGNITYKRWQSYYVNSTVEWESQQWAYQPFEAEGMTAGSVQSESSISVTLPATTDIVESVVAALDNSRLAELRMYEFNPLLNNARPQVGQTLIASYSAEIVNVTAELTTITMELGNSLAPIGAQVPPRKFTIKLIGVPCRL